MSIDIPTRKGLDMMMVRLGPARIAFVGSILLSLIAIPQHIINKDGILYVESARAFAAGGLPAALDTFNWPFLPILMSLLSSATGMEPEMTGHVLNSLFMAGACSLLVASSARMFPQAARMTCLVVLALPAFNGYREMLLREYGAWFFVMLSFWIALRWSEQPQWAGGMAAQLSIAIAMLFRPEAAIFFCALAGWQWFSTPRQERWRRMAMIASLPIAGIIVLSVWLLGGYPLPDRLLGEAARFKLQGFDAKTAALSSVLIKYAKDSAGFILFVGSVALVPFKFVEKLGLFVVPLGFALIGRSPRQMLAPMPLFVWAFALHWLVLCFFVLDMQFLDGRYVAPLLMLSVPLIGHGLYRMMAELKPFLRSGVYAIAAVIMLANVVSTSPGKPHYKEAGAWLSAHANDPARVYVGDKRVLYYAGKRFESMPFQSVDFEWLASESARQQYDMMVFSLGRKDPPIGQWMENNHLVVAQRFANTADEAILVVVPSTLSQAVRPAD